MLKIYTQHRAKICIPDWIIQILSHVYKTHWKRNIRWQWHYTKTSLVKIINKISFQILLESDVDFKFGLHKTMCYITIWTTKSHNKIKPHNSKYTL